MTIMLALLASLIAAPLSAAPTEARDPDGIDVADAVQCHIDASSYNGFALSIAEEPGIVGKRHWKAVASGSPFMSEYELPTAITVAGHYSTRRIAFTSTAILAILDVEDPAVIAREEKIDNAANLNPIVAAIVASDQTAGGPGKAGTKVRRFSGERVVTDVTEPAQTGERFGAHTVIAHTIFNADAYPGKILYGCAYNIEVLDKDGKPL